MKRVDFHPDAAEEARMVATFYEERQEGLGSDFQQELAAALDRIGDNPQMYAEEADGIRVCPLHRFPYSVFYENMSDRLWVAAVGHHRRRPGFWTSRKPD